MKKVEKLFPDKNRHSKQTSERKPRKNVRKLVMPYMVNETFLMQKSIEQVSWQHEI